MIILSLNPIKTARSHLKMTADEVAEKLNKITGGNVTKVEISKWENSKHKPNQSTIFALAKVLNVNPIKFYQDVDNHFRNWRKYLQKEKEKRYATNN